MLKRFFVKKLFGIYDNEINFNESGITVIVGQNGCGKTTMLCMLKSIFSGNHYQLLQYQFDYIEIILSGHILKIEPYVENCTDDNSSLNSLRYYIDSKALEECYRVNRRIYSYSFWDRYIPSLRRKSGNILYDVRSGKVLTLTEVIDLYFNELPEDIKNDINSIPYEVYDLIRGLQVELITTERLKKIYFDDYRRMEYVQRLAVEDCSDELSENLKNVLSEYANLSQKLDEQFPSKILNDIKQQNQILKTELKERIKEIDELRIKHVEAGVLEEKSDDFPYMNVNPECLDDSTATILKVYYQDMKIKLEFLNNISDKIMLFKNMVDNKLGANKGIYINKESGITIVQKPMNKKVELKFLSSGEQQELVLLYNLIFKGEKEKLVLIDEPEISLNVSWQREFLNDMKKIVQINKCSIMVATHSPQIINDNWNLVETLGELQ